MNGLNVDRFPEPHYARGECPTLISDEEYVYWTCEDVSLPIAPGVAIQLEYGIECRCLMNWRGDRMADLEILHDGQWVSIAAAMASPCPDDPLKFQPMLRTGMLKWLEARLMHDCPDRY